MEIWWIVAKGAATLVLIPAVIHYFCVAYFNPNLFLERTHNTQVNLKQRVYFGLVIVGLILITFHGFKWMLDWIPYSFGSHDEDGSFKPVRDVLAFFLASLSFPLLSFLDRAAIDKLQAEASRARIKELEAELSALKSRGH